MLLGFGGVSEYGITVRWDKNFLTILYLTLARNRHIKFFGGVRFGGTLTLDDAWALGFDHVAISAGAGRPTIIDMKNNLSRGIRKASDFLMALQLTGAYKHTSIANLQVSLPGRRHRRRPHGDRHRDRAPRLLPGADREGARALRAAPRAAAVRGATSARCSTTRSGRRSQRHLAHGRRTARREGARRGRGARAARAEAARRVGRRHARLPQGPRRLARVPPEPRGGRQEPRGGRPLRRAHVADRGACSTSAAHVQGREVRARRTGRTIDLPARTVCVAAGTSPNVIYERSTRAPSSSTSASSTSSPHAATVDADGQRRRSTPSKPGEGVLHELPARRPAPSRSTATTTRTTPAAS